VEIYVERLLLSISQIEIWILLFSEICDTSFNKILNYFSNNMITRPKL